MTTGIQEEREIRIDWHIRTGGLDEEQREEVLHRLPVLRRAARGFPVQVLHVEIDENVRKGGWGVSFNLQLPQRSLYAAEWADDLGYAARQAMNKIVAQVGTYRALLRRHERRSHRRELQPAPAPQAPVRARAELERLESFRERFARLLRHEIVHDVDLVNLPKETISVPDVVDEALVWTAEHHAARPPFLSLEQFFWRRLLLQFDDAKDRALRRLESDVARDRMEADHRERSPEVDMEWEDAEDLLFGGGEALPLDFAEETPESSEPGTILDREAVQQAVSAALRDLPEAQRRVVMLHDLEGYDPAEIAFVVARSEDVVRADLEAARSTLRKQLEGLE